MSMSFQIRETVYLHMFTEEHLAQQTHRIMDELQRDIDQTWITILHAKMLVPMSFFTDGFYMS